MKAKTLTIITAAALLAGSAALSAVSINGDVSAEGDSQSGRLGALHAPPAFSVVVTSQRATSRHHVMGRQRGRDERSDVWKGPVAAAHGWGDLPPDPRRSPAS